MTDLKNVIYGWKTLVIPDLVLESDITYIIDYFDYYNLANVKQVKVYKHPEQEYYVEDRNLFGYAVIEIEEWYQNNSSLSFYENLINENAKIIYDDPMSWQVEFYDNNYKPYKIEEDTEGHHHHSTCCKHLHVKVDDEEEEASAEEGEEASAEEGEEASAEEGEEASAEEGEEASAEEGEEASAEEGEEEVEEEGEEEVEEEFDDIKKDPSYEYEDDDTPDDYYYEHVKDFKKSFKKIVKSKTNSSNTSNTTSLECVVVKNKNYLKRNKKKPFNNTWTRRLRQKL